MVTHFVIDNQQHKMADVLNILLAEHHGHTLDLATAYFNVGGWQLLRQGLKVTEPQPGVYIKTLRKAFEAFSANGQVSELLTAVRSIGADKAITQSMRACKKCSAA